MFVRDNSYLLFVDKLTFLTIQGISQDKRLSLGEWMKNMEPVHVPVTLSVTSKPFTRQLITMTSSFFFRYHTVKNSDSSLNGGSD